MKEIKYFNRAECSRHTSCIKDLERFIKKDKAKKGPTIFDRADVSLKENILKLVYEEPRGVGH